MTTSKQAIVGQIGANVRQYRLEQGLTQEKLAEAASISEKNLSALENGRLDNISIGYLIDIADALGIDFLHLIDE